MAKPLLFAFAAIFGLGAALDYAKNAMITGLQYNFDRRHGTENAQRQRLLLKAAEEMRSKNPK